MIQMKRQILFTLVFFFILFNGYSGNYIPIVKESNRWNDLTVSYGSWMKISGVTNTSYKIEGDTSIQSVAYKKLLASTDSLNLIWNNIAFLREDTLQKTVWLRKGDQEGLIYNFNVKPGDTFSVFNPLRGNKNNYQVVRIDSILLQSRYRKTYSLTNNNYNHEIWIEGIGSEFGLTNSGMWVFSGSRRLLCFSDNEVEYVNPKFQTCRKTSFTPKITSLVLDTAVCNQEYQFQITTSEINDYDSVSFVIAFGGQIPGGFTPNSFDEKTGLISGVFTETGSFPLIFTVNNSGIVTDCISTRLEVVNITSVKIPHTVNKVTIGLNSDEDKVTVTSSYPLSTLKAMITDLTGKTLLNKILDNPIEKIDISLLSAGMYIIIVFDGKTGQKLLTEKWVKI